MTATTVAVPFPQEAPAVTVIKINAITVAADSGDELAKRFAARAGAVDSQDGFEGFELLKPADDRTTWLVVTRWRDDAAFDAWASSPAFGAGHQSEAAGPGDEAPKRPVGVGWAAGATRWPAARPVPPRLRPRASAARATR